MPPGNDAEHCLYNLQPSLSIIVPCYNEEDGLPNLFEKLAPVLVGLKMTMDVEVIYIDDGSIDSTPAIIQQHCACTPGSKSIRHPINMGIGAAIRTGIIHSRGDIIVPVDSDCTYLPTEIPRLLEFLDGEWDIVTASPYHPDGKVVNVPEYRLILSRGITRLYNLVMGTQIYTYTAMFRAYRRKVFNDVTFEHNDFIAMVEILAKADAKGYKIREMPTTLHSRVFGTSKMKLMTVIWGHMLFLLNIKGGR